MRKLLIIAALCLATQISPILSAPEFDGYMKKKLDVLMQNLLGVNEQANIHHHHYTQMETFQNLVQQADGNIMYNKLVY